MSKTRKTKTFYNQEILELLKNKYEVSRGFVIMALSGDRTSTRALNIKEDYGRMNTASKIAIQKQEKNLN